MQIREYFEHCLMGGVETAGSHPEEMAGRHQGPLRAGGSEVLPGLWMGAQRAVGTREGGDKAVLLEVQDYEGSRNILQTHSDKRIQQALWARNLLLKLILFSLREKRKTDICVCKVCEVFN